MEDHGHEPVSPSPQEKTKTDCSSSAHLLQTSRSSTINVNNCSSPSPQGIGRCAYDQALDYDSKTERGPNGFISGIPACKQVLSCSIP